MDQFTLPNLISQYLKFKKTERYSDEKTNSDDDKKIIGMTFAAFYFIFTLVFIFFVAALVLLVKNAHLMPTWAIVISIISLLCFTGGPIITIILCLVARKGPSSPYVGLAYNPSIYSP